MQTREKGIFQKTENETNAGGCRHSNRILVLCFRSFCICLFHCYEILIKFSTLDNFQKSVSKMHLQQIFFNARNFENQIYASKHRKNDIFVIKPSQNLNRLCIIFELLQEVESMKLILTKNWKIYEKFKDIGFLKWKEELNLC